MGHQPANLQICPGDWLRDNVSGCSLAAQGLWLRMKMLAHDSDRYGYLCNQDGSPMKPESIARRAGCALGDFETLFAELLVAGVPSRTPDGIFFCKHMIRDAKLSTARANAGKEGAKQKSSKSLANTLANSKQNGSKTETSDAARRCDDSSSKARCEGEEYILSSLSSNPVTKKAVTKAFRDPKHIVSPDEVLELPTELVSCEKSIREWLRYKKQRGETYKSIGFEKFLQMLVKKIGPKNVTAAIDDSMASNYAGVFPPKSFPEPPRNPADGTLTPEQVDELSKSMVSEESSIPLDDMPWDAYKKKDGGAAE